MHSVSPHPPSCFFCFCLQFQKQKYHTGKKKRSMCFKKRIKLRMSFFWHLFSWMFRLMPSFCHLKALGYRPGWGLLESWVPCLSEPLNRKYFYNIMISVMECKLGQVLIYSFDLHFCAITTDHRWMLPESSLKCLIRQQNHWQISTVFLMQLILFSLVIQFPFIFRWNICTVLKKNIAG